MITRRTGDTSTASLRVIADAGADAIAGWNQQLVDRLIVGINPGRYRLVSPAGGPSRSTLVVLEDAGGNGRARQERLASEGIDIACREGNLRLSLHLFNTQEQVDLTLSALHASAGWPRPSEDGRPRRSPRQKLARWT
jgi:cysteine desulfurase/selenocysteine lyase